MEPLAGATPAAGGPPGGPDRRGVWAMVAIAVLVIAGAAVAVVLSGGDDEPGGRTDTGGRVQTETGSTDPTVPSIPDFTVPSIPDFTTPSIPDFTVPSIPDFTVPSIPDFTVPSIPDFTVPSIPDFTVPSISDFGNDIPPAPDFSGGRRSDGRRTVPLTDLAVSRSADCGMPGYVVVDGRRYERGFIQCGANTGDRASGRFEVDLSSRIPQLGSDARLRSFSARVGIDEASTARIRSASFRVTYGTRIICSVDVQRGRPATCEGSGLDLPVEPGLRLEMRQEVTTAEPDLPLFAAFVEPEVTLG